MKSPPHQPKLTSLHSFTVTYSHTGTKREVDDFGKWIRRAITGSPSLRILRLLTDSEDAAFCNRSYDGLIDHLVKKHSTTLKILDMRSSFVGVDKLKALLSSCSSLEELLVKVDRSAVVRFFFFPELCLWSIFFKATFSNYGGSLPSLQYASFHLANVKPTYQTDEKIITAIMRSEFPSLRRISVNEVTWEVKNRRFSARAPLIFIFLSGILDSDF